MLRMPEVAPTSLSAGTRGARTPREGESRTLTSLERRWRRMDSLSAPTGISKLPPAEAILHPPVTTGSVCRTCHAKTSPS